LKTFYHILGQPWHWLFLPGFWRDPSEGTVNQFYILGITFMLVTSLTFSSVALLAGSISNYLLNHKKVGLYLKWLQISMFVGIAVYILIP